MNPTDKAKASEKEGKWIPLPKNLRTKIPADRTGFEEMYKQFCRDGYFYQDNQYLGSFIRRANMLYGSKSGHGAYGEAPIEILI